MGSGASTSSNVSQPYLTAERPYPHTARPRSRRIKGIHQQGPCQNKYLSSVDTPFPMRSVQDLGDWGASAAA